MSYLIETDRVVDWLQGRSDAVELVRKLASEGLAVSLITYGEVYEGIYYGRDPRWREREFQNFLRYVDVLPLSRRILQRFARERGQLRGQGQLIADLDLLIASTALHHNLVLVTRNLRHYRRVPNLELYDDA